MSQQPYCAIAQPWAAWSGIALSAVSVELPLRGDETNRDLERWSG
jgi:hypothetical protein